jgi:hypothetical protein
MMKEKYIVAIFIAAVFSTIIVTTASTSSYAFDFGNETC